MIVIIIIVIINTLCDVIGKEYRRTVWERQRQTDHNQWKEYARLGWCRETVLDTQKKKQTPRFHYQYSGTLAFNTFLIFYFYGQNYYWQKNNKTTICFESVFSVGLSCHEWLGFMCFCSSALGSHWIPLHLFKGSKWGWVFGGGGGGDVGWGNYFPALAQNLIDSQKTQTFFLDFLWKGSLGKCTIERHRYLDY